MLLENDFPSLVPSQLYKSLSLGQEMHQSHKHDNMETITSRLLL